MATETESPIIQLRDVRFSYSGGAGEALSGVTLEVRRGEHLCILGGNGSGKSTLVQMMNALLVPTDGSLCAFGIDLIAQPERALEVRRRAAMVFQHPEDQMVTSVVADDVAFGPENLAVPQPQIVRRVDAALAAVGMAAHAHDDPADLSGGQKQRIAIAGALAMEPEMLLLDEPGAMLDAEGRAAIGDIIRRLHARGATVVHVTHFMEEALHADRVIVMERGRIALEGTPQEIFSRDRELVRLGLERPFALELRDRLSRGGLDLVRTLDEDELASEIACALRDRTAETEAPAPADREETDRDDGHDTEPPDAPAIAFDRVSFSYADPASPRRRPSLLQRLRRRSPRGPLTLHEVSFEMPTGSITALIGHTGAGKSTCIELACALKIPATGAVTVCGHATDAMNERAALRACVGYVSQMPERQLFAQTVFDDVAFGPRNLGLPEEEVDARVRGALEACGLAPTDALLARSPFALSGGQQRGVALAGVIAMRQPILVLDEPMAGLDPAGRARTRALLSDLKARGTTLLLVTHSMDDVAELADRVIVLDGGAVRACGTPAEVFGRADVTEPGEVGLGLGLPRPAAFARALARAGVALDSRPITLSQLVEEVLHHGAARQHR